MFTAYIKDNEENNIIGSFECKDKDNVMNWVMNSLFEDLGNGGMSAKKNSDGSIGSLWRCADEIYDSIASGLHYSYANREFWISKNEEVEKKYIFRFSAVVDNSVIVNAKNYDEAKLMAQKVIDNEINVLENQTQCTNWHYDGNVNDEGDEEIKDNN